jgi:hypothetical protein
MPPYQYVLCLMFINLNGLSLPIDSFLNLNGACLYFNYYHLSYFSHLHGWEELMILFIHCQNASLFLPPFNSQSPDI